VSELVRVTMVEIDGVNSVVPDHRRRRPGRGASLHPDPVCLDLAERRRAFPRALRRAGPLTTTALRDWISTNTVSTNTEHQPNPEAGRAMR
jgi:predicted RNA-binding protein YlxR (DUF448 family)